MRVTIRHAFPSEIAPFLAMTQDQRDEELPLLLTLRDTTMDVPEELNGPLGHIIHHLKPGNNLDQLLETVKGGLVGGVCG